MIQSQWISGIGGMLMASAALLWFVNPAGAIQLESWDNIIPNANARFKVLNEFNGEAVLDKETQLVWEVGLFSHHAKLDRCWVRGARAGPPAIEKAGVFPRSHELASLIDPNASNPALPLGHPFTNVQSANYWSASLFAANPGLAWHVGFFSGGVSSSTLGDNIHAWCVRGGQSHGDAY